MGQDVAVEIRLHCEGWGQTPPLGMQRSFMLSFPLRKSMPSLRGKLIAVVRGSSGQVPLFHAVVLSDHDYAAFGRNPFAVAGTGIFHETWRSGILLDRRQLGTDDLAPLVAPPPRASDIGLVDEAVHQMMAHGKLKLPLEQGVSDSERCLALIIAALPSALKKTLRFASFATSEANSYDLLALESQGSTFASWQRLLMTRISGSLSKADDAYVQDLRQNLSHGNLPEIEKASLRHSSVLSGVGEAPRRERKDVLIATVPQGGGGFGTGARRFGMTASLASEEKPRPIRRTPVRMSTSGDGGGRKRPRSRLERRAVRSGSPQFSLLPRVLLVLVSVVAAAGGGSWLWARYTGADLLELVGLPSWVSSEHDPVPATTLLAVVDVGEVYDRQLKKVTGKAFDPEMKMAHDRREALAHLQANAAGPLQRQIELFLELAAGGIQQGSRLDRESERLRSLARQGVVLEQEVARLELAWHSFAQGADWHDLSTLTDKRVTARRDSLARTSATDLERAGSELGTATVRDRLSRSRHQVESMAALVSLFQGRSWTQKWEQRLYDAAEGVSPSASPMTRAYRNSAFAYVRLKKAERAPAHANLVYVSTLADGVWPSAQVTDALVDLRRQVGQFSRIEAPDLLADTIRLYERFQRPLNLVQEAVDSGGGSLSELETNAAVSFDPGVYGPFVDRIRFEAVSAHLATGARPDSLAGRLFPGQDSEMDTGFRAALASNLDESGWQQVAHTNRQPFFVRWAGHRAAICRLQSRQTEAEFQTAWQECQLLAESLSQRAVGGRDWTSVWLDLHGQAAAVVDRFAELEGGSSHLTARLAALSHLLVELEASRPLGLKATTVRLDSELLSSPTDVVLVLRVEPDGMELRSEPFRLGPAAPEGTGWVGTRALDWAPELKFDQRIRAIVLDHDTQQPLLEVNYPPLSERVGPGALARPRPGEGGRLSFRLASAYWRSLSVTSLD